VILLPVDAVIPEVRAALEEVGAVVLVAPPGSGKTTRVPPALVHKGRVVVLQPRRVAARASARRVADERGWKLGGPVGYRTRFDARSGRDTRVEYITEALLLRRLQRDPFLEDTATVVLDEFHERSLALDLSLALLAELRRDARPELGLVVMSATLDAEPVARFLGAPSIQAGGRAYPVKIEHQPRPTRGPMAPRVAAAVRRGLAEVDGHILVFLPGVGEIRGVLRELGTLPGADVLPLHGRLPPAEQDRAIEPSGRRKVVLSTNVAETSVTIAGVTLVIDTGLARVPRFDAASGVDRLELRPISQASTEQRAGRAGRTQAGRCTRLWTAAEQSSRPAHDVPAVRRTDLSAALLLLKDQGAGPDFRWFEPPPPGLVERAEALLGSLGATDQGAITARGRRMLDLPLHPRLASAVLEGRARGILATTTAAAALSAERDPFARCLPEGDVDLEVRLSLLAEADAGAVPSGAQRGALRDVQRARDQLLRIARASDTPVAALTEVSEEAPPLAAALLAGFPDRVGRRRTPRGSKLHLASGGGARLPEACPEDSELLLALALSARGRDTEATVDLAIPLDADWLQAPEIEEVVFDRDREAAVGRRVRRWGALILGERPDHQPDAIALSEALQAAATAAPERALKPSEAAEALRARVRWLAAARPRLGLPVLEDWSALLPTLCIGRQTFAQLRALDLKAALLDTLTWPQREALKADAPERITLPGGASAAVRYPVESPPVVSARIQQFFGLDETPQLAGQAVMLELLAPNRRPAQRTSDLPGFWRGSYADVRKDLRGRYPKHDWPEEPWTAPARRRRRR
jgi:ATP-dependent helicase HrpB